MMLRQVLAIGGLLSLTLAPLACEQRVDDTPLREPATDESAYPVGTSGEAEVGEEGAVRVADIVGEPDQFVGRTVTVEADVEEVFGPRAFALDEDAPLAGGIDNDLLVLGKEGQALAGIDDQWRDNKVRVTGTVARAQLIEIEREIGWDLDPQVEAELEDESPVLIAESVERVRD